MPRNDESLNFHWRKPKNDSNDCNNSGSDGVAMLSSILAKLIYEKKYISKLGKKKTNNEKPFTMYHTRFRFESPIFGILVKRTYERYLG